ncbi:hypothetical protein OHA55_25685 [Streptomyces sp. NBC_00102]|nr:hypothetical protein [Streptomyces sp. NBC_00102]MCX5400341.1 hypothetical protein [Streptomyces sp. NBC_00102]
MSEVRKQLADDLGDVQGVVEHHGVREQRVELHRLLLLDRVVVGDDAAIVEPEPLGEAVERLDLFVAAVTRRRSGASERQRGSCTVRITRPTSRNAV